MENVIDFDDASEGFAFCRFPLAPDGSFFFAVVDIVHASVYHTSGLSGEQQFEAHSNDCSIHGAT